ncbi:cysteine hydrolase [Haloarcula sp. S1CR25-12]|uniref:Cysteine hydrolase n=1 Tax=Haloarcula saliterrae TaxID=2950534 RepID=A0ABU2FFR6_9EURY|nr:isochorismatase family cysteine hydrolase [Haloarcula sp. S1CR25-12]MDS0261084.1 cysteine hydrolase [Haloarcula sp. S1CR25-12]
MLPPTDAPIGTTPALIVVDAQGGSPDVGTDSPMTSDSGSLPGGREAVIEQINEVVGHARDADVPIIWGKEVHRPDFADYGAEYDSCEPEHAIAGDDGTRLDDRLVVDEDELPPAEYVVGKQRYNFFHRTDIDHILRTYDVDTVILVGFMTHICVHYTAHGAHEHDYAYRVVEEGTASPTQELHEIGLRMLRYLQPRGVRNRDEVTAALDDYEGNPVVRRVKETGLVHPDTGPVQPLDGDPDPLRPSE